MKADKNSASAGSARPWPLALTIFVVLCGILAGWMRWRSSRFQLSSQVPSIVSLQSGTVMPTPAPQSITDTSAPSTESVVTTTAAAPQATPYARQLIKAISRLERANVSLTPEEAEQWKKNLELLIQRGPDGALAIGEFLQTNTDVRFGRMGKELLGVDSVREALFDALVRIGGPEAISAMLQAIQNSADPREIALLAQNLETLAPEAHRAEAITAAREVLAMAASGKLGGSDVAPLFEVLQNYGGNEVVADLEQASRQWEYYPAIALANLPEGSGIPSLIQMAQGDGPGTTMALRLLAQLSGKHASARDALLAQAQAGRIPAHTWPFLAGALAGDKYHFQNSGFVGPQPRAHPGNVSTAHVKSGNQTFYSAFTRGSLTQEDIYQHADFLDQLRGATSQPSALNALQQAATLLMERLPSTAAASSQPNPPQEN